MSGNFEVDFTALAMVFFGAILLYFLWKQSSRFIEPSISFSNVKSLIPNTGRASWQSGSKILTWSALTAFALAFVDPHYFHPRKSGLDLTADRPPPTEGIAIYLVLDQSGSMSEEVVVQSATEGLHMISKIDLLKQVSRQFILGDPHLGLKGRPDDMIGLVFFARAARVMSPLTLDHNVVLQELSKFKTIGNPDQDGTSIGYAIFKTANMISATRHYAQELISKGEPAYTIKNSVIILITDGLQDPNPLDKGKRLRNMDVTEAAQYAKQQGVKLYIVNVEPKLSTDEFAPYRNIMSRAAESTGGKFYMVDSGSNLEQIYMEIDKLEKSALPEPESIRKETRPDLYRRVSIYPYLIIFGLFCFIAAVVLETFVIRRIP